MDRVGVLIAPGRSLAQAVDRARQAEQIGCESVWVNQLGNDRDNSITLAAYAGATDRVGLGSFVFQIFTRHPTAMAQTAATLDVLFGGLVRSGLGCTHRSVDVMR